MTKHDACWYITVPFSFSASNRLKTKPGGTTPPGTYISPAETGLYYLQSRYYDPEMGRFINADGYATTGHGLIGNNMYAYCGNNPVVNFDPNGHKMYSALEQNCYGKVDSNCLQAKLAAQGVTYVSYGDGNGGRINNSYKVTNKTAMEEFCQYLKTSTNDFSGSVEGMVVEWQLHNALYQYFDKFDPENPWHESARSVDLGRTIYDDSHDLWGMSNFASAAMWSIYSVMYPVEANNDLAIFWAHEVGENNE